MCCEEINPREKPQRNTSETTPGKPRKKTQKEEGGHANRGDIHHQLLTYLDPLVFSTGMDLLPLPGADRG